MIVSVDTNCPFLSCEKRYFSKKYNCAKIRAVRVIHRNKEKFMDKVRRCLCASNICFCDRFGRDPHEISF